MNANELIKMFPERKPGPWVKRLLESNLKTREEIEELMEREFPIPVTIPLQTKENVDIKYYLDLESDNEYVHNNNQKVKEVVENIARTPYIKSIEVMPDGCPTGEFSAPVGTVIKSSKVHPGYISADMCCSLFATQLGNIDINEVKIILQDTLHFNEGPRKGKSISNKKLNQFSAPKELSIAFRDNKFLNQAWKKRIVDTSLYSCGASNHFVNVCISEKDDSVWLVSHFGSRANGASLFKEGMKIAKEHCSKVCPDLNNENAWIPDEYEEEFAQALDLIKEWTKLNHSGTHNFVLNALNIKPSIQYFTPHNFAIKEDGYWYHFKGATFMNPTTDSNKIKIIPLNMNSPILLCEQDQTNWSNHGCGRLISRSQWLKERDLKDIKQHSIYKQKFSDGTLQSIIDEELGLNSVEYIPFTGMPDLTEMPSAYKDANQMIEEMSKYGIAKIVEKLHPKISFMSGTYIR